MFQTKPKTFQTKELIYLVQLVDLSARIVDSMWYECMFVLTSDHRLRGYYGDRFDARVNLVDWDYHMRFKAVVSEQDSGVKTRLVSPTEWIM